MKVQCVFCEHEKDGFCTKKRRNGNPTRVKTSKWRQCASYKEDALRVLARFRAREAHRSTCEVNKRRRVVSGVGIAGGSK